MPNATGRAAKKTAPRKVTPAAGSPGEPKTERHVRSPLERAQAVYDKAKAASDKITARLDAAQSEVAALKAEVEEAKVTLDWAASHPLLVKARRDAEERGDEGVAREIDADATPTDARAEEGEPTGGLAGEPAPAPAVDVFEQDGEPTPAAAPAGGAPFDFDAPPAAPQLNGSPFDFDAASDGPQTTHIR